MALIVEKYEVAVESGGYRYECNYTRSHGERLLTVAITRVQNGSKANRAFLKKAHAAMCQVYASDIKIDGNMLICELPSSIDRLTARLDFDSILLPITDVVNTSANKASKRSKVFELSTPRKSVLASTGKAFHGSAKHDHKKSKQPPKLIFAPGR